MVFVFLLAAVLLACFGLSQDVPHGATDGLAQSETNEAIALSVYVFALGIAVAVFQAPPPVVEAEVLDTPLCGHCVRPVRDGVHFCPRCSAPRTVFAATANYESVFAQAWIFGKAIKHPKRMLHVIGMATVTGPALLTVPLLLIAGGVLSGGSYGLTWVDLAGLAAMAALFYVYGLMMLYCWRNWRSFQQEPELAPPEAGYGSPPWWTYDVAWTLHADIDGLDPATDPDSAPRDETSDETSDEPDGESY